MLESIGYSCCYYEFKGSYTWTEAGSHIYKKLESTMCVAVPQKRAGEV